ncbi:MAG TPA: FAD-dependent oxidoreductase [Mycobacteriales bacterium]|jgi:NADPH-dependent 2,4-dienoyl-CoA reductase/sulfur reductase-like enzyme|nr:FAD-dependent oxidoreductase [Mycobacteriales bacterium]
MAATAVVVGASVGGVRTAQALRAEGWPGRIVLVGAETEPPYDKPPLSKQVLAGAWEPAAALLLQPGEAERDGLELRLGVRAERLHVAERELVLAGGERLSYDVVVIATGARARPSPWQPGSGVHVLRTLADALELRAALARPGHVVVVGGGFIGAEVASTARALGCEVTLVDPLPVPMGRVLGEPVGQLFTELHERHGVHTRFGLGVERVTGSAGALEVELTDGSRLEATTVVVGIGAQPEDDWLADSGLLIDNGVVCDGSGRAQGAPAVYAVGDVARWHSTRRGEHVRIEHWTSAVEQAACVAHAITHPDEPRTHAAVEYVWSDQHDWRCQIVGVPSAGPQHEVLGDPTAVPARFGVVYRDGPQLRGAMCVNWPRGTSLTRRLLLGDEPADAAVDQLRALLAAAPKVRVVPAVPAAPVRTD